MSTASEAITESILDIPAVISFEQISEKIEKGDYQTALEDLDAQIKILIGKDKNLASFAAGAVASKLDKHDLTLGYLRELYQIPHLDVYTYYLRGRAYFHKRQFNVAQAYFDKALQNKDISRDLEDEVNFLSGQISLHSKSGSQAYKKLNPLVRRWRGSDRRADLLEILLDASLKKRIFSSGRYCKWFKDLYVDHPTNKNSNKWGFKDKNLKFNGQKINCKLTTAHKRSKLKRFYLEGLNNEIVIKLKEIKSQKKEHKTLMAAFHYYTGKPDKALKLLKTVKNFDDEYKDKLKIARTAYYAGETEYTLSVYKKLFEKEKRSYRKAWLLYEQASLNMELSNFNTAEVFYNKLVKDFKNFKYGRRALWGLPWSQFLSGQHKKAYEGFVKLKVLQESRPRRYSFVQRDQIDYWSARALQKSGRELEAVQLLQSISQDPMVSYYSILSAMRLEEIAVKSSVKLVMTDFLNRPWVKKSKIKKIRLAKFLRGFEDPLRQVSSITNDIVAPLVAEDSRVLEDGEDPFAEYQMYADSFLRSADMRRLGFIEESKEELRFVKTKAKTKNLKKRLLEHFKSIGDYSNLSRLAAISFSQERQSNDEENPLTYWKQAYPLAFKKEVETNAESYKVSSALIWGIMRAESFFDPKILSPVGARGLLQVMPYTATKLQILMDGKSPSEVKISSSEQARISESLLEPEVNVRFGASYLMRLDKQFNGHLPFVAAAYNAGPHRVKLWSSRYGAQSQDEFTERVPFNETKNYIKKVMRNMFVYSSLYGVGTDLSYLIKQTPYVHSGPVPFAEYWGEI
jgi:soluble lytic murein transglycosylase